MSYTDPFGNFIRYLRIQQAGLELWDAAKRLDVTITELYAWEQGILRPSGIKLYGIGLLYHGFDNKELYDALYTLWELKPLNEAAGPVWLAV